MGTTTANKAARNAGKWGFISWIAISGLSLAIGFEFGGSSQMWGSGLGSLVAGGFFAITALVAIFTTSLGPQQLGIAVLGSWLLKIVLLIGVLAWLRNQEFFSKPYFLAVLLIQTFSLLILEATLLTRAKVVYVEPDR